MALRGPSKITFEIGSKIDGLVKGLNQAQKKVSSFAQNTTRAFNDAAIRSKRAFQGVTGNAMWQQSAVAAAGMGFALKSSVQVAMRFEKAMDNVRAKIDGVTEAQMKSLTAQAKLQGRITKFTAAQVGMGQSFLAQAGLDPKEIEGMIPSILKLAEASDMGIDFVADKITNLAGGYGLANEQIPKLADLLAQTSRSGNLDLAQLTESFVNTSATAEQFGVKVEETAAAFALMGNAGIQAEKAGVAFRNILSRLQKGEVTNKLNAMGVETMDEDGNMRSLQDIMKDFNEATADWGTGQKGDMLTQLFGLRSKEAAMVLAKAMKNGDWEDTLAKVMKNDGAAAHMAKIMQDNLAGAFTRLRSALEGFQMALIGNTKGLQGLVDGLAKGINVMTSFMNRVPILGKLIVGLSVAFIGLVALSPFIAAFISVMASLKLAIAAIAAAPAFAAMAMNFKVLAVLGKVLFVTLSKGLFAMAVAGWAAMAPFLPIIAAVAGVAAAFYALWKFRKPMGKFFQGLGKSAGKAIGGMWKGLTNFFGKAKQGVGEFLQNWMRHWYAVPRMLFQVGKNMIMKLWDGLKEMWTRLKEWVIGIVDFIKDLNPFKGWGEAIDKAINGLKFWNKEKDKENDIVPDTYVPLPMNKGNGILGDIPKDSSFNNNPLKDDFKPLGGDVLGGDLTPLSGATTENLTNSSKTTVVHNNIEPLNITVGTGDPEEIAIAVQEALIEALNDATAGQRALLSD